MNIIQDKDGHWTIEEKKQQDSDIKNIEPIIIRIESKESILNPELGIIGVGDIQRELIDVLQHIIAEEGDREIIIIGPRPSERERRELTIGDFIDKVMEETRKEIFCIENILQNEIQIEDNIKEIRKNYYKQAKYHHKFHNQKLSGPKGQFAKSGRR